MTDEKIHMKQWIDLRAVYKKLPTKGYRTVRIEALDRLIGDKK